MGEDPEIATGYTVARVNVVKTLRTAESGFIKAGNRFPFLRGNGRWGFVFVDRKRYSVNSGSFHEWPSFFILIPPLVVSAYIVFRWSHLPHNPLLAAVIIIPLFLAIRLLSPLKAAWGGFLWSFTLCVQTAMTTTTPDSGFFIREFVLLIVPPAYAFAGAIYTRRYGFQPLALALGWVAVELALHPAGFPQGLLPSCCGNGIIQRAITNFLGYGFVAFVVILVNALTLSLTIRLCARPSVGRRFRRQAEVIVRPALKMPTAITVYSRHLPGPRAPPQHLLP
jgi:hypothetical protein